MITVAFFRKQSPLLLNVPAADWLLNCLVLAALSAVFIKDINIKPPKKTETDEKNRDLEGGTAVASLSGEEKKDKSVVEAEGETARAEGV